MLSRPISSARPLKTSHLECSSAAPSPQVDDTVGPQSQTEAERQAEAAMADEKDKIAVADELQRYIEEGVLDEEEYKEFSLTQYWQVSDQLDIRYFQVIEVSSFFRLKNITCQQCTR